MNFTVASTRYYNNVNVALGSKSYNTSPYTYSLYTNRVIYNNTNYNTVFFNGGNVNISSPSITTSSSSISNWSFDNLTIDIGNLDFNNNDVLIFNYDNNEYSVFLRDYITSFGAGNYSSIINIPRQVLTNYIYFKEDSDITFYYGSVIGAGSIVEYDLGTYNVVISESYMNDLNNNADRNVQNAILNTNYEINENLNDINNSITSDDVNFNDIDLPSDDSEDITRDGVNNIFTSIYNAFCTGQAQDIVFPIPFTNKNITLQANYVRQMLSNNGASWVITIIEAFWWYLISRFIVKDIMNKINKIKSGNIESIEQDNIKGDML